MERIGDGCAPAWRGGRRHFEEKRSEEAEFRPLRKPLRGRQPGPERPRGLRKIPERKKEEARRPEARHFPERARARGEETTKITQSKRVVVGEDGQPRRFRKPGEYDLERAMGKKVLISNVLDRRNGIECKRPGDKLYTAAHYSLGYYNNALWGGGVLPGSNFGFARATETTKENQKVFGKSLAELWNKSPSTPLVMQMCLDFLEAPAMLQEPRLFEDAMLEYHNEEPVSDGPLEDEAPRLASAAAGRPASVKESGRTTVANTGRRMPSTGRGVPNTGRVSLRSHRSATESMHSRESASGRDRRRSLIGGLRARFDAGQTRGLDMTTLDPRVVLGLLVTFLREMTPPLLTFTLYDKIMQTQQEPTAQARVETLRSVLNTLPPPNELVLFSLARYLNQLIKNPQRPVPVPLLSRLFSPLLLREDPRKPTSDFLQDPSVQRALRESVVTCMLENAAFVFPASALSVKRRSAHIPLALRRQLALALDDRDRIEDLALWEAQADLHDGEGSGGEDSDDENEGKTQPASEGDQEGEGEEGEGKKEDSKEDAEEKAQMEELAEIRDHYGSRCGT